MKEVFSKPLDPRRTKGVQIADLRASIEQYRRMAAELLALPQERARGCRVCGNAGSKEQVYVNGFEWLRCDTCDHFYKSHMPSEKDVVAWLSKGEPIETYLSEESLQYRLEHITQPKANFLLQHHNSAPGRWLDLGTGISDLPYYLRKIGWSVEATEINQSFIDYAAKHLGFSPHALPLDVFYTHFCDSGMPPFDVATGFGYFDLTADPMNQLRLVNKMLKTGGIIGINQPNHDSLSGSLAKHRPGTSVRAFMPGDYSFFSKQSLCYALEHTGFEVLTVWWYGLDVHELTSRMIESDPSFLRAEACELLYDHFNQLQAAVDQSRKSDFVFVCARKTSEI